MRNLCFQKKRFVHEELGWNYRMSNLQAALGVAQLERLEHFVIRKREIGKLYNTLLRDVPGLQLHCLLRTTPRTSTGCTDSHGGHDPIRRRSGDCATEAEGIGTRPFSGRCIGNLCFTKWDCSNKPVAQFRILANRDSTFEAASG
jgi:perosamine synthetase